MEKQSNPKSSGSLKTAVAVNADKPYNKTVQIQSKIEAHLIYAGLETGKRYEWFKAGDTVSVDERDAPQLIEKRLGGKSCCGGGDGNLVFQIVGG